MRVRLSVAPATPERLAGTALIVAWLLGAMNTPKAYSESHKAEEADPKIGSGLHHDRCERESATKHMAIPATLRRRAPIRSASPPANGRDDSDADRNDRELEPRNDGAVLVAAHERERSKEEHAVEHGVGERAGQRSGQKRRPLKQRKIDQRRLRLAFLPDEQKDEHDRGADRAQKHGRGESRALKPD